MLTFKQKQILSLISGCMIHTVFGAMYTLGTITPYIASHIYYQTDPNIKVVDVSINYPVMMITQTFGIILAMLQLQFVFRMKVLCFAGIWGFAATVFIASFMNRLWSYTIFYGGFFGFFVGIAYMSPFKNTYSYFPNRKGMCAGICMMGYGIGSFVYNQIFLHLVNPNNLPANRDHIFPQEVAQNFPMALRILALIYLSLGTVGCLLFIPLKKEENIKNDTLVSLISQTQQNINHNKIKKTPMEVAKNYLDQFPYKKKYVVKIWLTVYTSAVYGVFIAYNYKEYGQTILNNDNLITLTGSLGCVSNSLGRIFWCSVFDYLSFKKIMTLLDFSLLACCTLCIFIENQIAYILIVIFTYFFSGSFYGLMPTQTVRIFGDEVGTTLYPFIFSAFALASISQFIIHEVVIRKWGNDGFRAAFIGFGVLQIISILFVRSFQYKEREKLEVFSQEKLKAEQKD